MAKRSEKWLGRGSLALIAGWRRQGESRARIAARMGVSVSTLRRWSLRHEEILRALEIDREMADFMVEAVLFEDAMEGDQKAYMYWLKHRLPGKWGKTAEAGADAGIGVNGPDFVGLAEMINNPVERGDCGSSPQ